MKRLVTILTIAAIAALMLLATAVPSSAREILGCNGIIQWPCPGPVLVDP